MVTVVDSTIGGSTPDYSTIAAWEAATDNDLPTDDEQHNGKMRAGVYAETVTIAGATTDSTRFRRLTYDTGAFHGGAVGSGARITPSGSGDALTIDEDNFQLVGAVTQPGTGTSDEAIDIQGLTSGETFTIEDCIIWCPSGRRTSQQDGIYASNNQDFTLNIRNTAFFGWDRGAVHLQNYHTNNTNSSENGNVNLQFCDFWNNGLGSNTLESQGCISFYAEGADTVWTVTATGCLFHVGTPDSGDTFTVTVNTGTGSTDGAVDFTHVDCIFSDSGLNFTVGANVTESGTNETTSATFTTSTAASAVIFADLTSVDDPDLHLTDHANNIAIDYVDNDPTILAVDFEGDARATGASAVTSAGWDELSSGTSQVPTQTAPGAVEIDALSGTASAAQTPTQPTSGAVEIDALAGTASAAQTPIQTTSGAVEIAALDGTASAAQTPTQPAAGAVEIDAFSGTATGSGAGAIPTQPTPGAVEIAALSGTATTGQSPVQPAAGAVVIQGLSGTATGTTQDATQPTVGEVEIQGFPGLATGTAADAELSVTPDVTPQERFSEKPQLVLNAVIPPAETGAIGAFLFGRPSSPAGSGSQREVAGVGDAYQTMGMPQGENERDIMTVLSSLVEWTTTFGGGDRHIRQFARMVGGTYFEGYINGPDEDTLFRHESLYVPKSIVVQSNLDGHSGYVAGAAPGGQALFGGNHLPWTETTVVVRSTIVGNYAFVTL